MSRRQTKREFVAEVAGRVALGPNARVIGVGEEAVVIASASSVFKCYSSNPYDRTGFRLSSRERAALKAFGGYTGEHVSVPALKGHKRYMPFEWNGRKFTCTTELSRMSGKPVPHGEFAEAATLGKAIAEFHILLSSRPNFSKAVANKIEGTLQWCAPGKNEQGVPPDLYKRLKSRVQSLINQSSVCAIHGDLHHENVLNEGRQFAFLDHSMTSISYPEHDMAQFSLYPETLRGIFKGYAAMTGARPSKKNAVVLYSLDLAQLSVQHQQLGNQKLSSEYLDELRAVMS